MWQVWCFGALPFGDVGSMAVALSVAEVLVSAAGEVGFSRTGQGRYRMPIGLIVFFDSLGGSHPFFSIDPNMNNMSSLTGLWPD